MFRPGRTSPSPLTWCGRSGWRVGCRPARPTAARSCRRRSWPAASLPGRTLPSTGNWYGRSGWRAACRMETPPQGPTAATAGRRVRRLVAPFAGEPGTPGLRQAWLGQPDYGLSVRAGRPSPPPPADRTSRIQPGCVAALAGHSPQVALGVACARSPPGLLPVRPAIPDHRRRNAGRPPTATPPSAGRASLPGPCRTSSPNPARSPTPGSGPGSRRPPAARPPTPPTAGPQPCRR